MDQSERERREQAGLHVAEAAREHLERATVGLIAFVNGKPPEMASGTLIAIAGRVFVATCAHFLRDNPIADIEFVGRDLPAVRVVGSGFRGGRKDDEHDVGWIELGGVPAAHAIDIDRLVRRERDFPEDLVIVAGCPAELLPPELLKRRQIAVRSVYYLTNTLSESEYGEPLPAAKMVLDYPASGNKRTDGHEIAEMFEPFGMSGGGTWLCDLGSARDVWSPARAQLIGIQIAWSEPRRVLYAQPIGYWIDMLRADVPELSAHLPVT